MKRLGSIRWNGGLRQGQGAVSTESRALESCPYSFFTRYGEKPGTNPEERRGPRCVFRHVVCQDARTRQFRNESNARPEQSASGSDSLDATRLKAASLP